MVKHSILLSLCLRIHFSFLLILFAETYENVCLNMWVERLVERLLDELSNLVLDDKMHYFHIHNSLHCTVQTMQEYVVHHVWTLASSHSQNPLF